MSNSDDGIHFQTGIDLEIINTQVIAKFLTNLANHKKMGELYRPVDASLFRDSVVDFLNSYDMVVRENGEFGGLGFIVQQDVHLKQEQADVVHRAIVLANKLLLTTRETDKPFTNYIGTDVPLSVSLDRTLDALHPLMWGRFVEYAGGVSLLMSTDREHNIFPTLVSPCFEMLCKWYDLKAGKHIVDRKVPHSKDDDLKEDKLLSMYREKLRTTLDRAMEIAGNVSAYPLDEKGKIHFGTQLVKDVEKYTGSRK